MHARFTLTAALVTLLLCFYSRKAFGPQFRISGSLDARGVASGTEYGEACTNNWRTSSGHHVSFAMTNNDVFNATLGFEKIFTISLPERSDRRDAFTLQARLSGMSFEFQNGVSGADVSSKVLPMDFDQDQGTTGCWRAHLNVMQEIIRTNVQSALIFEDDADWDVTFRQQMRQASNAALFLTESSQDSSSPYGDDWDIISLGHCAALPEHNIDRYFVVPQDLTVLPPDARLEWEMPNMKLWEDGEDSDHQTRIYFKSAWLSCLTAYAISLRGAEKILYRQSMLPWNEPIDNGIGSMCKEHTLNMSCISVFPTLVGVSKPAGAANRGSDIRELEDVYVHEHGWSEMVMYSIRQNIPRLLQGSDIFRSTYSQLEEKSLKELSGAVGHPEWVIGEVRYFNEIDYTREKKRLLR